MLSTDQFRNRLAFFLVAAFVLEVPLFVFVGIPETSKEVVTYMMGQLSGMALMALGHYFTRDVGQDEREARQSGNTTEALKAIQETAKAAQSNTLLQEKENGTD